MIKTLIVTGDLDQGEEFHVTDAEDFDEFVRDPLTMLASMEHMGYSLLQVVPTMYHCSGARISLRESIWIFAKHADC